MLKKTKANATTFFWETTDQWTIQIRAELKQLDHVQTVCTWSFIYGMSLGFTELSEVVLLEAKDYRLDVKNKVSEGGLLPVLLHQVLWVNINKGYDASTAKAQPSQELY